MFSIRSVEMMIRSHVIFNELRARYISKDYVSSKVSSCVHNCSSSNATGRRDNLLIRMREAKAELSKWFSLSVCPSANVSL